MIKWLFLAALLLWPQSSQAGFLDGLACVKDGSCGLQEVILGLIYLIRLMLGGMGAVALIYFVIGGLQWLTSSGSSDKIKKGRDIMTNTILALALAFSSYIILDFFVNKVLGVKPGSSGVQTEEVGLCGQDVRAEGQACQLPTINMVCYQGRCISECQRKKLLTGQNWHCSTDHDSSYSEANGNLEVGLCPGGTSNVCIKD